MVLLEKLEMVNMFNVRHQVIDMADKGLVLVVGRNGAGKSSMFIEGVFYLFFGQSFKYGASPGDSVVCDFAKPEEESYEKGILVVDDIRYEVVRCRRSKQFKTGLSVFLDGKDLSHGTSDATQDWLTSLLGMGADAFKYSVVFNHEIARFPLLSDAEKKRVLDEILQLHLFEVALKITRERVKTLKSDKKSLAEQKDNLLEELDRLSKSATSTREESLIWESGRESRIAGCETELEVLSGRISSLSDNDAVLDSNERELKQRVRLLDEACDALEAEWNEGSDELSKIETALQSKRSSLTAKIQEARKALTKATKLVELGKCPECGSPTNHCHTDSVEDLTGQVASLVAKLAEVDDIMSTDFVAESAVVETRRVAYRDKRDVLVDHRDDLTGLMDRRKQVSTDLSAAKTALAVAVERLASEQSSVNPHELKIRSLEESVESCSSKLVKSSEKLSAVLLELGEEEVLEKVFGSKGARLMLIQSALPLLNVEAARIRNLMGVELGVKFSIRGNDESYSGTFQVEVTNPHGSSNYKGDSSGEKACVDLILILSLLNLTSNRGRKSFGQSFFDEAFDKLDGVNEVAVLNVLKDIAKNKSSVFVLSHGAEEIGGQCDAVWRVEGGKLVI